MLFQTGKLMGWSVHSILVILILKGRGDMEYSRWQINQQGWGSLAFKFRFQHQWENNSLKILHFLKYFMNAFIGFISKWWSHTGKNWINRLWTISWLNLWIKTYKRKKWTSVLKSWKSIKRKNKNGRKKKKTIPDHHSEIHISWFPIDMLILH